ncbi:EF-hand domain-containing protein [Ramlibacter algicola]|uniref:EF-hand domain-containing protein n=1 Tax=Ramlibacter algicola TaxID=2795217 RepID=A0A934PYG1_9BURK|nr:EF-hand domain-containing protein [Ramlibacter algicola]MBK0391396.1 hypothetical protein [Ramlibacter algicola]
MHRRFSYRPRPLMILLAIVLCLIATTAFAQVRRMGAAPAPKSPVTSAAPSPSGLTSGAAPGLTAGMPSASGITSGSAALPAGTPAASGLTSGTAGAAPGIVTTNPAPDTTVTTTRGSTRGVVVLPPVATAPVDGSLPANAAANANANAAAAAGAGAAPTSGGTPSVDTRVAGGPMSPLQTAQVFAQADADADGLLTRAEALRLQVVTMSFDDMDTNRDGVVSRSEYDDSLR